MMRDVPAVNAKQMAKVDEIMRDHFGVEPIQLMEHAGFNVAVAARMLFALYNSLDQEIVVLAGSGGNGGDALVVTRFLHSWGAEVTVILSKPADELTGLGARQLRPLERLRIPILDGATIDSLPDHDVIIDGLLGINTRESPRGGVAKLIELANASEGYVLSIDVPSGMNATTGKVHDPHIVADGTVTLGLPKTGLMKHRANEITGNLMLVDIGILPAAYERIGVTVPRSLFSESWLLPLRAAADPWAGGQIGH